MVADYFGEENSHKMIEVLLLGHRNLLGAFYSLLQN